MGAPWGIMGGQWGAPGPPLGIPFAAVLTHGSRFCRSLHSCQHHCLHGVTFIFILRHLLSLPSNMLCALVIFTSLRPRRSTNRNILKLQNRKVRVTIYMWNVPYVCLCQGLEHSLHAGGEWLVSNLPRVFLEIITCSGPPEFNKNPKITSESSKSAWLIGRSC